uniref:PRMT5 oligomerisation domain-containing protein n=2 Tax=Amphimedon queenslandica TaxID=400682 RepID=A0A1X7V2Y5_AMPQE
MQPEESLELARATKPVRENGKLQPGLRKKADRKFRTELGDVQTKVTDQGNSSQYSKCQDVPSLPQLNQVLPKMWESPPCGKRSLLSKGSQCGKVDHFEKGCSSTINDVTKQTESTQFLEAIAQKALYALCHAMKSSEDIEKPKYVTIIDKRVSLNALKFKSANNAHPKKPIQVCSFANIEVHMWRCSSLKRVWYEWLVTEPERSDIHNAAHSSDFSGDSSGADSSNENPDDEVVLRRSKRIAAQGLVQKVPVIQQQVTSFQPCTPNRQTNSAKFAEKDKHCGGIKRKCSKALLQAASETEEEDSAQCTVTSLQKGKPGKPLILGKNMDSEVQDFIRTQRSSGAVVSRSMVVAIGKGMVMKHNAQGIWRPH